MLPARSESGSATAAPGTARVGAAAPDTPVLDVVVCTYNRADDLDRCLHHLAQQEGGQGNWRVTVVDNNCTDRTADVVATHAAQGGIPRLCRLAEPRQGLTPARQRGVRDSTSPWIAFVDDDCLVASDWIRQALGFIEARPQAAAFGGRVLPAWGRSPPAFLPRHAWLFAAQDHGDSACRVESLVGAGVVLNRAALIGTGWLDAPLLADRTGLGYVSGGDVEISLRLSAAGGSLWYAPDLRIEHRIALERQSLREVMRLADGLGAGAELASLLAATEPAAWLDKAGKIVGSDRRRHVRSTLYVLRRRYAGRDWLIRWAFLSGQTAQHRRLARDPSLLTKLAGGTRRGRMGLQRENSRPTDYKSVALPAEL
jgi:glycosyltransferase involved in cell wall biosynthesis